MGGAGFSILAVESRPEGLRAEIEVETGGRWFDGHFPEAPVLPAIAHFDLLCRVHRAAGGSGHITALDRVRLTAPVRPGDRLELILEPVTPEAWRFALRAADGRPVSDGLVRWADEPGAPD